MIFRTRLFTLILTVSLAPVVLGQEPGGGFAPPVPTGPPLVVPAGGPHGTTWVENAAVSPVGGGLSGPMAIDAPWPGPPAHVGSACNFDIDQSNAIFPDPTSYQMLTGAYFSTKLGPPIPTFNYVPVSFRIGWDLGPPWGGDSPFPGHWEFLADVTGAAITSSYGTWFAGSSFFLRYNWTDPGSLLIPYAQGGVGGIVNDAYKDRCQRAVGQAFEFYLHAELGLKCMIAPNLSLDFEGGLQHISNAGLADRNYGVNALGGSVGLTYYFGGAAN
jgi:hypothetical protein